MRLFSKLLGIIALILVGYWLAMSGLVQGTIIGDGLNFIMGYLPITSEVFNNEELKAKYTPQLNESFSVDFFDVNIEEINPQVVRDKVLSLTNDLRVENGLHTLSHNQELEIAGDIRAEETTIAFSHTRPNGQNPFTVLDDTDTSPNYNYSHIGENLGMATYHRTDEYMAELIFEGWVDSEGHLQNILKPEYTEIGIGVAVSEDKIYITQFFGRPL